MRTVLLAGIFLTIIFLLFQTYIVMASSNSEVQPFTVVEKGKDFEIRFYPAVTMAMVTSSAKSYKELGYSGFRKLAHYIFGGNESSQKIAMTAPVHMDINDSVSSMSFVMPAQFNQSNLPKPDDAGVTIHMVPDEYVACIGFNGYASDKDIKKYTEKLESALKEANITYYGNFRYLGYNPPYQFFGRKNEIIISVNKETLGRM